MIPDSAQYDRFVREQKDTEDRRWSSEAAAIIEQKPMPYVIDFEVIDF
jgi:hypothetical protein